MLLHPTCLSRRHLQCSPCTMCAAAHSLPRRAPPSPIARHDLTLRHVLMVLLRHHPCRPSPIGLPLSSRQTIDTLRSLLMIVAFSFWMPSIPPASWHCWLHTHSTRSTRATCRGARMAASSRPVRVPAAHATGTQVSAARQHTFSTAHSLTHATVHCCHSLQARLMDTCTCTI